MSCERFNGRTNDVKRWKKLLPKLMNYPKVIKYMKEKKKKKNLISFVRKKAESNSN